MYRPTMIGRYIRTTSQILATFAIFASQAAADEPLRWKFNSGDKYNCSMVQDMTMTIDAGPAGQMQNVTNQLLDITWDVESVNDAGEATMRQKVERVRIKMSGMGNDLEYDTDSEEPPAGMAAMIAPMFDAMTAAEFHVRMSPRGEIVDVQIPEHVVTALRNAPGGAQMGEEATLNQLKSMVSQGSFVLPADAPTEGEEWTSTISGDNPMGGKQSVETTYRYEGTRSADGTTYAVIRPTVTMTFEGNPAMQLTMQDQKTEGEVLFDQEAGRLHSMAYEQDAVLNMTVGGQTIPGKLDQKVQMTVTPATD